MTRSLFLVFSDPVAGNVDAYHEWYDRHVADIVRVPGFAAAQRYALDPEQSSDQRDARAFAVVYEIDGDVGEARAALTAAAKAGTVERPDPTCVSGTIYSQVYRPIRDRVSAEVPTSDTAEARPGPLTLKDRSEVEDLLSRYTWAFDSRDGDAYAAVFTADGIMEGPATKIEGREALRNWAANFPPKSALHRWTNLVLEGNSSVARARTYLLVSSVNDGTFAHNLMGTYHDELHKTSEGWRIKHRHLVVLDNGVTAANRPDGCA